MWCVEMMSKVMSRVFFPSLRCVFIVHFVVTVLIASVALAAEPLLFGPDLMQTHTGRGIEI
jgi:hypothetical protein